MVWCLGLGAFTAGPEFDPCRSNSGLTDPCTDLASLEKGPKKEKNDLETPDSNYQTAGMSA